MNEPVIIGARSFVQTDDDRGAKGGEGRERGVEEGWKRVAFSLDAYPLAFSRVYIRGKGDVPRTLSCAKGVKKGGREGETERERGKGRGEETRERATEAERNGWSGRSGWRRGEGAGGDDGFCLHRFSRYFDRSRS